MLGFAPISSLPLDTLPQGAPVTGTAGFTESGLALLANGTVVNPAQEILALGGISRHQWAGPQDKPKTAVLTRKAARITAKARFNIPSLRLRATGEVRNLVFHATGTVINPITGRARFTLGKMRLRSEGEIQSITDNDLVEFSQLLEELIDA